MGGLGGRRGRGGRFGWVLVMLVILVACGDDDGAVDAAVDAGTDVGAFDGGVDASDDAGPPDAGPPPPTLCDPCRRDSDCGEGLCLILDGGERACGVPCGADADCAALPDASCEEEAPGFPMQCRPNAGTCVVSALGSACPCEGRYDVCADPEGTGAYCTRTCRTDADCPEGAHRCRDVGDERLCVQDERPHAERCDALAEAAGLRRCEGSCPAGTECVGDYCLPAADPDADPECPGGLAPFRGRCVPAGIDASDVLVECACHFAEPGLLEDAAAELGRTRCDLGFTFWDALRPDIARDPFRLTSTDRMLSYWPSVVDYGDALAADLDDADTLAEVVHTLAAHDDLRYAPRAPTTPPLLDALERLAAVTGGAVEDEVRAAAGALDAELAAAFARVVDALSDAHVDRESALAAIGDDRERMFLAAAGTLGRGLRAPSFDRADHIGVLRGDVDLALLARAAHGVGAAIDAADFARFAGQDAGFDMDTPIGRIAIRGAGDDTYAQADWERTLLLVELGGDDTYRFGAGATSSATHGLAVVVDVAGVDDYGYDEVRDPRDEGPEGHARLPSDDAGREATSGQTLSATPRQGAGSLGVGLLVDLGAEGDRYRSLRMSQGWGALGVGVLFDAGGDDHYHLERMGQGGASFGLGALVDRGGADEYIAYSFAQGFAYVRAVGALADHAGNDRYRLVVDDNLYPSSQNMNVNASLGQGAGFGRRADFTPDMVFMSGGIGVLRDRAGDDTYRAAIFAQGTGFWFGAGFLLEGEGDDRYDGQWYVQGGAAHFAIAALIDDAGDDVHNEDAVRQNVTMGGGHDFSIAWHLDRAGADTYHSPSLSLGAGNQAGAGIFWDLAGIDRYQASSDFSFGNASVSLDDAFRRSERTVGMFLEGGADVDVYARPTPEPVANDALWRQTRHDGEASEEGVGIDR